MLSEDVKRAILRLAHLVDDDSDDVTVALVRAAGS